MMKNRIQRSLTCVIFATTFLTSCEIRKKGTKDDPSYGEQGKAAVESFFLVEYAAISNPEYQEARSRLSSLLGRALVVSEESTFKKWWDPELGCRYYQADAPEVALVRTLDIGDLNVRDPSGASITITKDPKDYFFSAMGMLNMGSAALSTTGSRGSFQVSHSFDVLDSGSKIAFTSVQTTEKFNIPTPKIVAQPDSPSSDPDGYYLTLNRSQAYNVSYQAPPKTQFVRLTIEDNTSNASNWIVCYGRPDAGIFIPVGALSGMRATTEALLTLDFVTVDVRKDIPRMKESFVLSYSRHYHGRRDLNDIGINNPAFFGKLILE